MLRSTSLLACVTCAATWAVQHHPFHQRPAAAAVASASMKLSSIDTELPVPPAPKGAKANWEVHKFGGASLATADLYKQCSDLLESESRRSDTCIPTMAIVSAKGGVTDRLIKVVEASRDDMIEAERRLVEVANEQIEIVKELANDEIAEGIAKLIREDAEGILNVVRAVGLLRTVPGSTMELVTGYGEVWSAMTMYAYLATKGVPTAWLDAREVLIVEQSGFGLGDKGSANVRRRAAPNATAPPVY